MISRKLYPLIITLAACGALYIFSANTSGISEPDYYLPAKSLLKNTVKKDTSALLLKRGRTL